jgi:predicted nucleic acid-binding protein
MLDTNVLDALADSPDAIAAAIRRITAGEIALVITHVQRDQFAGANEWKRTAVAEIPFEMVTTFGVVTKVSCTNMARLAGRGSLDPFQTGGKGKMTDALVGLTAAEGDMVLVTNDDALFKKATAAGVETWRPPRLIEFLVA